VGRVEMAAFGRGAGGSASEMEAWSWTLVDAMDADDDEDEDVGAVELAAFVAQRCAATFLGNVDEVDHRPGARKAERENVFVCVCV